MNIREIWKLLENPPKLAGPIHWHSTMGGYCRLTPSGQFLWRIICSQDKKLSREFAGIMFADGIHSEEWTGADFDELTNVLDTHLRAHGYELLDSLEED